MTTLFKIKGIFSQSKVIQHGTLVRLASRYQMMMRLKSSMNYSPLLPNGLRIASEHKTGAMLLSTHQASQDKGDHPPLTSEEEFKQEQEWTWAAPTRVKRQGPSLPVKIGEQLTKEEVLAVLEEAGGQDLRCVDIADSKMANFMIFSTGKSPLHLRRMADILVTAVKQRKLRHVPAYTGAEGYGIDDGWILVDTEDLIIQLMDAETREHLKLEDHWLNIHTFRQRLCEDPEALIDESLPCEEEGLGEHGVPERTQIDSSNKSIPSVINGITGKENI